MKFESQEGSYIVTRLGEGGSEFYVFRVIHFV